MSDLSSTTLVVREYFSALDCPRSLCCWLLYKYGEHQQLVELEWSPSHYNSFMSARDSLAATSYLSKATFLNLDRDKEKLAYDKFFLAELECEKTNIRLATVYDCEPEIFSATRKIASILGSFCPEEWVDSCNWGPGATLKIKADSATAARKFDSNVEITPTCYHVFSKLIRAAYPIWDWKFVFAKENKVITVPKNAKTDRIIAIEPSMNLWLQKGVGCMIRDRLKRFGIDLRDQGHNQRLARIGSKFNNLATIDFSAASDTIAINTVLSLIPGDWLNVLVALRSPRGLVNNSSIEYEKFSSMGNGYTFELESLIFLAIGLSVTPEEEHHLVSIYGDDLVLPSRYVERAKVLFTHFGFTINMSKSYWDSPYRESCGKHYWCGSDITPVYLKEAIQNETDYYKAHNAIRRFANRLYSYGCDLRFRALCQFIRRRCLSTFRRALAIPESLGDSGFISNFDESCPPRLRHGHQGFLVRCLIETPREVWSDSHGLLLSRLWCTRGSERSYGNVDSLPRRTRRKCIRTSVSVWCDLGPWM